MENYSSLSCEIRIIRARNIERRLLGGNLFVRCYVSAGEDQSVQINTQEIIPSKLAHDQLFWNESFALDCSGTQESIDNLKQGSVVFELHSRKNILPILGGSKISGMVEIPWKSVFESTNMEIVEWAIMGKENVMKPMEVQIAMKVISVKETTRVKKNDSKLRRSSSCACMGYCGCNSINIFSVDDCEVFALGAALGAL